MQNRAMFFKGTGALIGTAVLAACGQQSKMLLPQSSASVDSTTLFEQMRQVGIIAFSEGSRFVALPEFAKEFKNGLPIAQPSDCTVSTQAVSAFDCTGSGGTQSTPAPPIIITVQNIPYGSTTITAQNNFPFSNISALWTPSGGGPPIQGPKYNFNEQFQNCSIALGKAGASIATAIVATIRSNAQYWIPRLGANFAQNWDEYIAGEISLAELMADMIAVLSASDLIAILAAVSAEVSALLNLVSFIQCMNGQ